MHRISAVVICFVAWQAHAQSLSLEDAQGWMVGAPNQGIQNMFVMMNLARIMVGFQGLGLCELATQNAVRYALDRKQGKSARGTPTIADHADVRRMLLTMKAVTEGGRMLAYETALEYATRAKNRLSAFAPSQEREALLALTDYVCLRDR